MSDKNHFFLLIGTINVYQTTIVYRAAIWQIHLR